MKTILLPLTLIGVAMTGAAQEPQQQPPRPQTPDSAEHRLLHRLAGEFTTGFKVWGMGDAPMTATGSARGAAVLGGRFVRLAIEMPMMGRTMRHEVTLGFDRHVGEFDFTWLSDQGDATVRAIGKLEKAEGGQRVAYRGRMNDAMAGDRPVRHEFLFRDDGGVVFTTWDTLPDGKELRVMEIAFAQQKK